MFFLCKPKPFVKLADDKSPSHTDSNTDNNGTNIQTDTSYVNNTSPYFYPITVLSLCLTIVVLGLNSVILLSNYIVYDAAMLATTLMVIGLTVQLGACCTALCISRFKDSEKKLKIVSRVQECACVFYFFGFFGSLYAQDMGITSINMLYIIVTSLCLVALAVQDPDRCSLRPSKPHISSQ